MESRKLLKWNLQLFTDGGDGGSDGDSGSGEPGGNEPKQIVFANQSEFDSAVDKQITKALNTAQEKWKAESDKAIQQAQTEAQRLAGLTAEEKAKELKKQEDEALNTRLAEITRRELRAEALEALTEKELPKELIDAIVLTNADDCNKSIEAIEKSFRAAVEVAVNKRLVGSAGAPPAFGNSSSNQEGSTGKRLAQQNLNKQTESKFFKN